MEFTYNGFLRYGFGFLNPNHAAAFITMLLPFCWALRSRFFPLRFPLKVLVFVLELALYAGLVFTYSRTGIAALAVTAIFFYFLYFLYIRDLRSISKRGIFYTFLSVFILLAALLSSGAYERYSKWIFSPDRSLTNRLELWRGGLAIAFENPFGTGTGLSGKIYTDFISPHERSEAYRTMVNSFMTLLCEQGFAVFFIVILFIIAGFFNGYFSLRGAENPKSQKLLILASMSLLLNACISGIFSTVFDLSLFYSEVFDMNFFMQMLLGAVFVSALLFLILKYPENLRKMKLCLPVFLAALTVSATLYICCAHIADSFPYSFRTFHSAGKPYIRIVPKAAHGNNGSFFVCSDEKVTIKQIRKFTAYYYPEVSLIFPLEKQGDLYKDATSNILFCGRYCSAAVQLPSGLKIICYNPSLPPSGRVENIEKIYLDIFDEYRVNDLWIKSAPPEKIEYLHK